jgi:hypothetical protein
MAVCRPMDGARQRIHPLDPLRSFTTDCFGDAKAGETVRPVRSPLLRQIHLTQQRFEARVAIEWHKRRVYFDEQ